MTSYASVPSAVEAMKLGAADYIAKPFDHEELLLVIRQLLKQRAQERSRQHLKSDLEANYPVKGMIGQCAAMQRIFEQIAKVAPTSASVLLLGESGTGKELVARAIHEQSTRNEAPFVAVNCASIPENLVESRRHPVSRRDRRAAGRDPVPAAARTSGRRASPGGVGAGATGRCPSHRRHQPRPALHGGGRRFPRRPLFPAQGGGTAVAAAARTGQRHHPAGRPSAGEILPAPEPPAHELHTPGAGADPQLSLAGKRARTGERHRTRHHPRRRRTGGAGATGHQDHLTETELARQLGISRKTLWQRRQKLGIPRG